MEANTAKNPGLERRRLLVTLIQKELGEKSAGSVVFDIAALRKHKLLSDLDELIRALDRLRDELKPDFDYRLSQFIPRKQGSVYVGSKQGVKVIVDDLSKLEDYLHAPAKKPALGFDPNKSRLYVRGKEIVIRKFSDQYHTLRIIFDNPKDTAQNWFFSDIAEKVDAHKPNEKTYYNAIHQVRLKLDAAGFPDFFRTTKQSVQISPEYLS